MQSTSTQYKLVLLALSPLALAHVIYRSFKDGGIQYFLQRLGFTYTRSKSKPIHFHCASVGEYLTAKALIFTLLKKYPDSFIAITTNTPTAASLVKKDLNNNIAHYYFPLDFAFSVNRFLKHVQPCASFIMETEIWPTYYSQASKLSLPISIINARLSNKTLQANSFIKREYKRALINVNQIFTRSKQDLKNYLSLGADPQSVVILGNLKYAMLNNKNDQLACTTIKRPFFLGASTHEDEELQLSRHVELLKRKNYLLVLAPRYPDRCKALAKNLKYNGLNVAVRSEHDEITDETDIYIVDTLGELDIFYNEAALVFVGGSLIGRGGHNVLEPARYGKCIMVGPYTENFALEINDLLEADAIIQVNDNNELGIQLISLLKNDSQRESYGKNAMFFVSQHSEILNNYLENLESIIEANKRSLVG